MPIFFEQDVLAWAKLGIWEITEAEAFFLEKVVPQRNVSHPHKKLQHLAGRYLLKYLFPPFPVELIKLADTRKPFLANEAYHFSISHCGNYAAALVSKHNRVGVDIELMTDKIVKVQHKFLSGEELEFINEQGAIGNRQIYQPTPIEKLTLLWSCKEAVFKWYGLGEVDFKEHIVVKKIKQISERVFHTEICFEKEAVLCCSYIAGSLTEWC